MQIVPNRAKRPIFRRWHSKWYVNDDNYDNDNYDNASNVDNDKDYGDNIDDGDGKDNNDSNDNDDDQTIMVFQIFFVELLINEKPDF